MEVQVEISRFIVRNAEWVKVTADCADVIAVNADEVFFC